MKRRPEPPEGLVARGRGRRFWRAAWSRLDDRLVYDEVEIELLTEVCRVLDLVDDLEDRLRADGPMTAGSKGQPVAHPAVPMLTAQRALLGKLLTMVDFGGEEVLKSPRQVQAAAAARSRWDAPGARRKDA